MRVCVRVGLAVETACVVGGRVCESQEARGAFSAFFCFSRLAEVSFLFSCFLGRGQPAPRQPPMPLSHALRGPPAHRALARPCGAIPKRAHGLGAPPVLAVGRGAAQRAVQERPPRPAPASAPPRPSPTRPGVCAAATFSAPPDNAADPATIARVTSWLASPTSTPPAAVDAEEGRVLFAEGGWALLDVRSAVEAEAEGRPLPRLPRSLSVPLSPWAMKYDVGAGRKVVSKPPVDGVAFVGGVRAAVAKDGGPPPGLIILCSGVPCAGVGGRLRAEAAADLLKEAGFRVTCLPGGYAVSIERENVTMRHGRRDGCGLKRTPPRVRTPHFSCGSPPRQGAYVARQSWSPPPLSHPPSFSLHLRIRSGPSNGRTSWSGGWSAL